MKISSQEIATLVNGVLHGDPARTITGAAGLLEATENDISFLGNAKYAKFIAQTKAALLLLPEKQTIDGKDYITVKNPQLAFAKVLSILAVEKQPKYLPGVSHLAYVSKTAKIGKDVHIGHFAVVEDNAQIGDNTKILAHTYIGHNSKIGSDTLIYPSVMIRENIVIGDRVIINSGAMIGTDGFGFVPSEKGIFKIPQLGTVEIGSDVEIGANVTVDRATTGRTKIGNGTKIDNLVQIAHNVELGANCIIVSSCCIAGSTKIGNGVTIGGQTAIAGHVNIEDGVMIAGKSGVSTDIKKGEVVSGFPARPHREELKLQAMMRKLPEIYQSFKKKG